MAQGIGKATSETCRERFKVLLKEELRVKNAEERKKELEERKLVKKGGKEEKRED